MVVAIITARANSKGLPGKNMLNLGGLPLIQHTFEIASKSEVFDKIILSTDLESAIELSQKYSKIEVPFKRPEHLCGDNVSQVEVVNHVLDYLAKTEFALTHFVLLQPTAPFRTINEMRQGVDLLKSGSESVLGVTKVMHHPADYLIRDESGLLNYLMPEFMSKPRQSFPPVYFNSGGFYGCSVKFFKEKQIFYDKYSALLIMNEKSVIDIDTEFDLKLANCIIDL
ncbi:MAG: acylneuraminate cytidylyltransferase family protein [Bacteroidia bacterium]|nr:acylneuraminate cytidylyltransferase family protein [Bacteroidia bacterium]